MPPFVRKTDADRLRCMPVAGDTLMNYYKELFVATTLTYTTIFVDVVLLLLSVAGKSGRFYWQRSPGIF